MLLQHVIVHNTLYMQCVTDNGVFLICYHNIIDIHVISIISAYYGLLLHSGGNDEYYLVSLIYSG